MIKVELRPDFPAIEIHMPPKKILLISVYMPSRGFSAREEIFVDFIAQLSSVTEHHIIMVGDWNATALMQRDVRDNHFQSFIREMGLSVQLYSDSSPTL